jgi:UDP-N-acetylglucosamine/UDP-N-acetylgalactosamine diphosphorylase
MNLPDDLRDRLRRHGQEHVLSAWNRLSEAEQRELSAQLADLDLDTLSSLYGKRDQSFPVPDPSKIEPVPVIPYDAADNAARRAEGEAALRRGEVAVLLVAGGQGSRLGFEQPKGMFPIGPVSRKTLFHIHSEKVQSRRHRHAAAIPYLVMTSPATHAETVAFFEEERWFGLAPEDVFFFMQGTMPALDLATGRLLLERPGKLFQSPDGHGGTLTALAKSGLLERLKQRGIKTIFYFQVDNPLVKIVDPTFLGHHLHHRSEASSKIIAKVDAKERMGVFTQIDGRCAIIEYSDLPTHLAEQTDASGRLRLWAGNPAIHLFDVAFLDRVTRGAGQIPFHIARKKVPHVDELGKPVQPAKENALKFERFIFDVLPLADRWLVVESRRAEEFAPVKNATGADSPSTAEQAISDLAAAWLQRADVRVPCWPNGCAAVPLEVCPLFALDADEFARRVDRDTKIDGPRYFE